MINIEYFEELAQGDESVKNRLLKLVHEELVSAKQQLEAKNSHRHCAEMAEVVHKIKPKFKMFNMEEEFKRAEQYNKQLKSGRSEKSMHETAIDDINQFLKYLTNYL
ncbi:MAG: hypothetical protein LBT29_06685 [Flavobacteriaceae bacterium]|jgi:uncharacterized protein YjaG (DUF416 family)|nr:hypothetical protein [Flavobacteriaceae bacterium]